MFVLWCNLTQSSEPGEEDEGWPTYEAAASAVSGAQEPAWVGRRGLVLGNRAALLRAQAFDNAWDRRDLEDAKRRAATLASFAVSATVAVAQPPLDRTATLLAINRQALATEQAKGRRADAAEIARLQTNVDALLARIDEVNQ